jgi:uncharacterized protein (TIGR03000 family)
LTPANAAEVEAVRKALQSLRQKAATPPAPSPGPAPLPTPPADLKLPGNTQSQSSPARVVVSVPENAKLWVEQVLCPLTGEQRAFNTPALQPGNQYYYTLTVELAQGGRESRRVEVQPGRTVEVDFRAFASSAPSTITAQR